MATEKKHKLSKRGELLLSGFAEAAMHHGLQQEYGTGKDVDVAAAQYEQERIELHSYVAGLERDRAEMLQLRGVVRKLTK